VWWFWSVDLDVRPPVDDGWRRHGKLVGEMQDTGGVLVSRERAPDVRVRTSASRWLAYRMARSGRLPSLLRIGYKVRRFGIVVDCK
jgi:hypothetical protein